MHLHPLAQRSGLTLGSGFLERRNVGRRRRWRRAKQIGEQPAATHRDRRAVGIGRDGQHARLAEEASACAVGERDPPEMVAVDIAKAVMCRQPLVEKRIVGGQQLHHAAVVVELAADEQLRLLLPSRRAGSRRIPDRARCRERRRRSCSSSSQRLAKWSTSAFERGSRSMRCTCRSSATGSFSVPANRRRSQLVVWNAAPEKERQPRGQVEIADAIGRTRSHACRLAFDAKQKAGSREDALESALDTGIETTLAAAGSVKTEQRGEVGVAHRTPIGARRERRQDLFRARFFRRGVFGPADEDLAAARRISRCGRTVRTANRHELHRGIAVVILVGRASESGLRRLQHAFGFPEAPDERHTNFVLARLSPRCAVRDARRRCACTLRIRDRPAYCRRNSPGSSSPSLRRRR